jgi:hypothetical protein
VTAKSKFKIRDVLLVVYSAGWAAAVGVALVKTGEVSPTLFAALGLGVGTIIGAFRVESVGATAAVQQQSVAGPTDATDSHPEDASS